MRLHTPDSLQDLYLQLSNLVNGGIDLGNQKGALITFETNGGEQQVRHGLGYIPALFDLKDREDFVSLASIRKREWTKEVIFVKSNMAGVTVTIFIH